MSVENSPDATVDLEVLSDELRRLPVDEAAVLLAASVAAWRAGST